MCTPEDIPEDREQSFQCPDCGGEITLGDGLAGWECNGCNFYRPAAEKKKSPTAHIRKNVV